MSVEKKICVPDIGGAVDVDVIEIRVSVGDKVSVEDTLITLEGDKATMEIPSPEVGTVKSIQVALGDKISEGAPILMLAVEDSPQASERKEQTTKEEPSSSKVVEKQPEDKAPKKAPSKTSEVQQKSQVLSETTAIVSHQEDEGAADVHAGPAVRRLARELGVNLAVIKGSGEKGRIVKNDVDQYVKQQLARLSSGSVGAGGGSMAVASMPAVDFSQFGETDSYELTRIKKLSGASLHRNWVTIPHVTQFGEADITDLEAFRCQHKQDAEKQGFKLTPIVFVMKSLVSALRAFPHFNASLDASGEHLILKKYFNIGVAVDTPNGLVVPVIRQVDKKSLFELAQELSAISEKARSTGLSMSDMQGSSFTLSSLGGVGGTAFTPIINAPDVAILGLSKAQIKPIYQKANETFAPRLMLPLSLSYDHRVIDGADGARFLVYLTNCLSDVRRLLL